MNKTASITFRLKDSDRAIIERRAKQANMKLSDFCRHASLGKEVKHIEGLPQVVHELNKIGNNLNQLTMLCHKRQVENPDLGDIGHRLDGAFLAIEQALGGDEYSHH